jgi:CheY-like chemotaxis protein
MSNLLSNALKNTSHGGIHVAAQLIGSATNAPMLRIEVTDTGPGIPSHLHRTLFEPFSQARKPKAGAESNGLGLSICRTMAQQMGGDLTIAPNREGESGAQFVLTLTLAHPPVDLARAAGDTGLAPTLAPAQAGISGLKVLVIDDIATNRLVASTYLRMLGATMLEAESGAKGLEILAADCPDLVLLDMNMPEMNGLQTLANIRALPCKANKIPVIAMTADAMAEHRDFYLSSGLDGYLAKPINPERIESEIKAVLDKASKPRPD